LEIWLMIAGPWRLAKVLATERQLDAAFLSVNEWVHKIAAYPVRRTLGISRMRSFIVPSGIVNRGSKNGNYCQSHEPTRFFEYGVGMITLREQK
jgi:hypothetical protein